MLPMKADIKILIDSGKLPFWRCQSCGTVYPCESPLAARPMILMPTIDFCPEDMCPRQGKDIFWEKPENVQLRADLA